MRKFVLSVVSFVALCVGSVSAQEVIYVGEGAIPADQLVNVVAEVNGISLICGTSDDASHQPAFVASGGQVYLYIPSAESPRSIGFAKGTWPSFKATPVWFGEKAKLSVTLPKPGTSGYSWWFSFYTTEAAYKAASTPEALKAKEKLMAKVKAELKKLARAQSWDGKVLTEALKDDAEEKKADEKKPEEKPADKAAKLLPGDRAKGRISRA